MLQVRQLARRHGHALQTIFQVDIHGPRLIQVLIGPLSVAYFQRDEIPDFPDGN